MILYSAGAKENISIKQFFYQKAGHSTFDVSFDKIFGLIKKK